MTGTFETVYLGHDNSIELLLKADGVSVSLAAVTVMKLTIGEVTIESDNGDSDPIRWAKEGYASGEVRLFLGDQPLVSRGSAYDAWLTVYDASNADGIVWGKFRCKVSGEVEKD
jgi:hypothetical protein